MSDVIHRHIAEFSQRDNAFLQRLTAPLHNHCGTNYFCYQRVDREGNWLLLGDSPAWLDYSAANKFYEHDPSLVDPRFYQSGIFLATQHCHQQFHETLVDHAVNFFDINHALIIMNRHKDYCDYFFICAPTEHYKVYQHYYAKQSILHKFCQYFLDQTVALRESMLQHTIQISDLAACDFSSRAKQFNFAKTVEKEIEFCSAINIIHPTKMLTKSELRCLRYLQQGFSAKETAQYLGISHRTVEEYIENIKRKYHARSKQELCDLP